MYFGATAKDEIKKLLKKSASTIREHSKLDETLDSPVATNFGDTADVLEELRRRYDEPFRLAVVGDFNVGKSYLINALLGKTVVEEGVTPTTGSVTELWWAEEERGKVVDQEGEVLYEGELQTASKYADQRTQEGSEASGRGTRVLLYYPFEILKNLVIIDTPGLGANPRDDEATVNALHNADAALLVSKAKRPGGDGNINLAERLRQTNTQITSVITQADLATEDERETALEVVGDLFGEVLIGEPIVFSAKEVKEAQDTLRAASQADGADAAAEEAAKEKLEKWGYFELQDRLNSEYFAQDGRASRARDHKVLGELQNRLRSLRNLSAEELAEAEERAEEIKEELSESERVVNQVLRPKIAPINAKIEDEIRLRVGEFVDDLSDAVELFIDRAADGSIGQILKHSKAKLWSLFGDDSVKKEHQEEIQKEFEELFGPSQRKVMVRRLRRSIKRLLKVEWQTVAQELEPELSSDGFEPTGLVSQINDHLEAVYGKLGGQIAAFIGMLLVPGGAVYEALLVIGSALGISARGELKEESKRVARAKREARLRIRKKRKLLVEELYGGFQEVNQKTFEEAKAAAREGDKEKRQQHEAIQDRADEWKDAHEDLKRLGQLVEEFKKGDQEVA